MACSWSPNSRYACQTSSFYQQGVDDIPLDDVRLSLRALRLSPEVVPPQCDLLELVKQEDSLALGLGDRFHDQLHSPCRRIELFNEQRVVTQ